MLFPPFIHNNSKLIFKQTIYNGKLSYRCSKHSSKKCKANYVFLRTDVENGVFSNYTIIKPHSCFPLVNDTEINNESNFNSNLNNGIVLNNSF